MIDIEDIDAEIRALEAAKAGDFEPLANRVLAEKPLSENARKVIAERLKGKFRTKRGTKTSPDTVSRNKEIYLEFLHLRRTGECPNDDVAYATIAHQRGRKVGGIRKAVKAGKDAMSNTERHILRTTGMS